MSELIYKNVMLMDDDDNALIPYVLPATTTSLGVVKPDGETITITADGTISSLGGGISGSVGSNKTFIYAEDDVVKPCTQSLGSSTTPVYLANGVFTQCSRAIPDTSSFVSTSNLVTSYPVTSSYHNGTSWAYKYSTGLIVQGNRYTRSDANGVSISFQYQFSSSNYLVICGAQAKEGYTSKAALSSTYAYSRTTSSMYLVSNTTYTNFLYFEWIAIGY